MSETTLTPGERRELRSLIRSGHKLLAQKVNQRAEELQVNGRQAVEDHLTRVAMDALESEGAKAIVAAIPDLAVLLPNDLIAIG